MVIIVLSLVELCYLQTECITDGGASAWLPFCSCLILLGHITFNERYSLQNVSVQPRLKLSSQKIITNENTI